MYYAGKIFDILISLVLAVFFATTIANADGNVIVVALLAVGIVLLVLSVIVKAARLVKKVPNIELNGKELIFRDIMKTYKFNRSSLKISRMRQLGGMLDLIRIKDPAASLRKTISVKEIPPQSRDLLVEYYEEMTE